MRQLFFALRDYKGIVFAILAATAVSIVMIFVGNLSNSPAFLSDLGLNIVSEIFGIFFTLAIIEKLLRDSEKRKQLPLKNHSYARLMELVIELMFHMSMPGKRTIIETVYFYGDSISTPRFDSEIEKGNYKETLLVSIKSYRQKMNEYIDIYGYLLEPEILMMLQELKLAIDNVYQTKPAMDEVSWTQNLLRVQGIALNAAVLYKYLATSSSRHTTYSELVKELDSKVKAAAESLNSSRVTP